MNLATNTRTLKNKKHETLQRNLCQNKFRDNILTNRVKVNTDIDFIRHLKKHGGDTMKKCFQCATCSVSCELSPKEYAFPRKEMIQAAFGMKEKLLSDPDVWLCHGCMDCSLQCPRNAKPADLMGAVRSYVYRAYAVPNFMGKALADPKQLPWLMLFSAACILVLVLATNIIFHDGDMNFFEIREGVLTEEAAAKEGIELKEETFANVQQSGFMTFDEFEHNGNKLTFEEYKAIGGMMEQAAFIENYGIVKYEDFVHKLVIEAFFIPGNLLIFFLAFLGLRNYWRDMEKNSNYEVKRGFWSSAWAVLGDFLSHNKFEKCPTNSNRHFGHLYAFYGFLLTAIATGLVVVGELYHYHIWYLLHLPYPMNLLHPVKILGMIGGALLFIGLMLLLIKRAKTEKEKGKSTYNDWLFIWVIFGVAVTGISSVFVRMTHLPGLSFIVYFIHLVLVFFLLWYMPYSKFAHMIYRYTGLIFLKMRGRENRPEVYSKNFIKTKEVAELSN